MTLIATLRERLLDQATLVALIGSKVYATTLPQTPSLPAVRITQIGRAELMHMRGPVPLYRARVQVDSVSWTKEEADAVDAAVEGDGLGTSATGLKGWRGSIGSPAVVIDAVLPIDVQEMYEAGELRQYWVMRDYFVWFRP